MRTQNTTTGAGNTTAQPIDARANTLTALRRRYEITRGDTYGTTDNRADRWYIDSVDGPIDRPGKGYRTAELAQDALDALEAGLDWLAMPQD